MTIAPDLYKIEWSFTAEIDLNEILIYIAAGGGLMQVTQFQRLLNQKFELLKSQPKMGHPGRELGTRAFVIHPHYIVFYEVKAHVIKILGLKHAARHWPYQS